MDIVVKTAIRGIVDEHFEIALFTGNDKFNTDLVGVFRHITGHLRGSVSGSPPSLSASSSHVSCIASRRSVVLYALRQRIEESFKISIHHLVKVFGCFLCNGLLVGGLAEDGRPAGRRKVKK